jgi:tryptophanyl-tRNA synthetase
MSRIFTGIQPSGELHIGNYLGAVKNWVRLQHEFESIISIVDYHAITVAYDPGQLRQRRHEVALTLLAAGIDPNVATLYVQSQVPEHTELAWILNTITPLGELERQTQFKEKSQRQESVAAGILNYPVLQAADILLYRADKVPVGEDQVQHLELSRVLARRWNAMFARPTGRRTEDGADEREPFFPEPDPLLTHTPRVMGLDGHAKMSKSMGNAVGLLESPESIWSKLRPAVTDPKRIRRTDPGTPEVCNIYHLHRAFSAPQMVQHVAVQCSTAGWGCIDCKKVLAESMERELAPIRARAAELGATPQLVEDVLSAGADRCRDLAHQTMDVVRDRMGF